MKWYNHRTLIAHKEDVKVQRGEGLDKIIPFVSQIANTFPREYVASGILDINDFIQSGYVGLIEAWNKVDWELIEESSNPQGKLWSFLKKRIKGQIRRDLDKYASFVARPINQQEKKRSELSIRGVDKVLVTMFGSFFNHEGYMAYVEDFSPYKSIILERLIEDQCYKIENNVDTIDMLLSFYGIGRDKMSTKQLADKYRMKKEAVSIRMHRLIKKLKTNEFEELVKNF